MKTNKPMVWSPIQRAALGFLALFAANPAALAQEDEGDDRQLLDEIVVTGKKGTESLQELPASVLSFNEQSLENLVARDFDALMKFAPGVNLIGDNGQGSETEVASIRGLSRVSDTSTRIMARYLDGAPRSPNTMNLYDISEVSIFRGPMGTLWGAQSLGGVISIQSARPDPSQFSGFVITDFSNYDSGGDSLLINGALNMPAIEDKLAFRVAAQSDDRGGYVDSTVLGIDDINTAEETSFRLPGLFKPSESSAITLIYHNTDLDSEGDHWFDEDSKSFKNSSPNPISERDGEFELFNLIADFDLGSVSLNYTGSFYDAEHGSLEFGTFGGAPSVARFRKDEESITHELRLISQNDSNWSWIAGLWYDDYDLETLAITDEATGANIFVIGRPDYTKEQAIFGEVTYKFNDKFSLLVGGRYYEWEVDSAPLFTFRGFDLSGLPGIAEGDGFLPKIQLLYYPTDDIMVYALRSEGFRIGGFNAAIDDLVGFSEEYSQWNPDELSNYEIGTKTTLLGGRMILNASLYYMDWEKVISVVPNENVTFWINANVPDLEGYGGEIEIAAQDVFVPGLYFALGYAHTKNEFQDDARIFDTIANIEKGDELRRTIRDQFAFNFSYDWFPSATIEAFIRGNYSYKSSSSAKSFNRADGTFIVPSHNIVGASIGFRWKNALGVTLYSENLTNDRPIENAEPEPGELDALGRATSIPPRTVGLRLTYDF